VNIVDALCVKCGQPMRILAGTINPRHAVCPQPERHIWCPECGNKASLVGEGVSFASYVCDGCQLLWTYDAEHGTYSVDNPLPKEEA
jgi:DNA-directed RNA polymerase subunit RPC12/RpoP